MPLRQSLRKIPVRLALFAVGLTLLACVLNPWQTLLAVLQTAGAFLAGHIFLTLAAAFLLAAIPYKRLGNKLQKPNLTPNSTFLLIFIPLIALSLAIIFLLPSWYVHLTIPGETPEHRLTHEETERKDTGALLLSLFGAYGLYLTWRRAEAGDRTVKTMEQGHITDRYTKAIEQLGKMDGDKPNIEVRLGAIYALERIAWDSPTRPLDHHGGPHRLHPPKLPGPTSGRLARTKPYSPHRNPSHPRRPQTSQPIN